jgi:hypothetical protein
MQITLPTGGFAMVSIIRDKVPGELIKNIKNSRSALSFAG